MPGNGHSQDESPKLEPVLHEILRTCVHPRKIVLRIEHVIHADVGRDSDSAVRGIARNDGDSNTSESSGPMRLFLTDGELLMQGLPHRNVSGELSSSLIRVGNFVEIYKFEVKRAKRSKGSGHVVYLGIKDCVFHESAANKRQILDVPEQEHIASQKQAAGKGTLNTDDTAGGFIRDEIEDDAPKVPSITAAPELQVLKGFTELPKEGVVVSETERKVQQTPSHSSLGAKISALKRKLREISSSDEDEGEDAFETALVDLGTAKKRRQTLLDFDHYDDMIDDRITHNLPISGQQLPDSGKRSSKLRKVSGIGHADANIDLFASTPKAEVGNRSVVPAHQLSESPKKPRRSVRFDASTTDNRQKPDIPEPPLHTLASLLHPPPGHSLPRKNYALTTFAVITYVGTSLISRPGSPFPPKRHIKIDDPSLHTRNTAKTDQITSKSKYTATGYSSTQTQSKGITVAVYRDALNFKPDVGTPALFRGLVMQRLPNRDIILNAYPSSKAKIAKFRQTTSKSDHKSINKGVVNKNAIDMGLKSRPDHIKGQWDNNTEATEDNNVPVLSEDDWFMTSPTTLSALGYNVEEMRSWWQQMYTTRHVK